MSNLHIIVDELIVAANGRRAAQIEFNQDRGARVSGLFADHRDLATTVTHYLKQKATFEEHQSCTGTTAVWEVFIGQFQQQYRYFEALQLAYELYYSMLEAEERAGVRIHKGMPLVRIADAYKALGYVAHEERYLMLTLCEDAIRGQGVISPNETGIYFRLVWGLGLSDEQVRQYAEGCFKAYEGQPAYRFFPEGLLQDVDPLKRWQLRPPASNEMSLYKANPVYVSFLLRSLGDGSGKTLERLAEYILSCMAGCHVQRRLHSQVTEYDLVCSMNAAFVDFRTEFGRYFVCECKDWKETAGISVIAKFCRILDSTKARFGILFSSAGISGMADAEFSAREQQKIFQDRGLVIVVVDSDDIFYLVGGANFIRMLRQKYETVRLDLDSKKLPFAG